MATSNASIRPGSGRLGWTLEELRSQPFVEFVHPDDREQTEAEAASLTSADYETITFENRYRCKDGSYRTMLWSARSIPQEGLIYATGKDVTESQRAQEELHSSERFLDSVLENLPNMVFVKDAEELRFVRFNRAGEELIGSPREELIGKNDHDLFPATGSRRLRQEGPRSARLRRGRRHPRGADRHRRQRLAHPPHPQDRDPRRAWRARVTCWASQRTSPTARPRRRPRKPPARRPSAPTRPRASSSRG